MPEREVKFVLLLTVFISCISVLNVISAKLWNFSLGPLELTISGGIIAYWFTFPVTDVVAEVFGRQRAQLVVWLGFLANLLVVLLTQVAIHLPAAEMYAHQEAFRTVLGAVPVIVLASLTAYLVAQSHDVWAFHFWRRVTRGRHLWLRNNLSTVSSQLLDSLVFNGIAFGLFGAVELSVMEFVGMTLGYWLFKVLVAVCDTPVVYLLIYWFTGRWGPADEAAGLDERLPQHQPE
jgi:uncharacterized integral membrane protein (TIGR00697 family)